MTKKEQVNKLNKTVWVRIAPSNIHKGGVGIIAIRDIPEGTRIASRDYNMYYLTVCDMVKYNLHKNIQHLILDRYPNLEHGFESPNNDAEHIAFMNHSNDPNSNGYISIKDIKAGEEVTENYYECSTKLNSYAKKQINY